MPSILIRQAGAEDAAAISELITELGYELSSEGVEKRMAVYEQPGNRA